MGWRRAFALVIAGAAAAVPACGKTAQPSPSTDGGRSDAAPSIASYADFCAKMAPAACAWYTRCRQSDCSNWGQMPWIKGSCGDVAVQAVQSGRLSFDGSRAAVCLSFAEDACGGPPRFVFGGGDACTFLGGSKSPGEPCTVFSSFGDECTGGYCLRASDSCDGHCIAYRKAGESCGASDDRCVAGTFCDETKTCTPYGERGSTCSQQRPCRDGLSCVDTGNGGKCLAPVPEGGTCTYPLECAVMTGVARRPDGTGPAREPAPTSRSAWRPQLELAPRVSRRPRPGASARTARARRA
jgi:hypothetical protein